MIPEDRGNCLDNTDILFIKEEEEGERLDKILAKRFEENNVYSRTYFQYLIDEGLVFLNGSKVKKRIKPKLGDEIEIHFILTPETNLIPEPIALNILFEDSDIIVVNKPAGMVVHPAPGNWKGTFVNALLYHCNLQNVSLELATGSGNCLFRPGIVHRLDKDTSGVMVAAKSLLAQQRLIQSFANRQVQKQYLAICLGNPGNLVINAPIGRHPTQRKLMAIVQDGGKSAISRCQHIAYDGKLSIVRVFPETGRTHQIRVHMKHIRSPILGDIAYGNCQINEKYQVKRQMLHAEKIYFSHPVTGIMVEFEAPLPLDIEAYIQKISP